VPDERPTREARVTLSNDDVRHVARLARLGLSDEEVEALRPQLAEILAYAEQVGEVAAGDVPPMTHAMGLRNVLRADAPTDSLDPQAAISNAPEAEDGRFRVPRIMEEER
jgi:aspartyl-tRNA(Asn)/glutamyl-tRNA(Gln) amidotransferase subunit C